MRLTQNREQCISQGNCRCQPSGLCVCGQSRFVGMWQCWGAIGELHGQWDDCCLWEASSSAPGISQPLHTLQPCGFLLELGTRPLDCDTLQKYTLSDICFLPKLHHLEKHWWCKRQICSLCSATPSPYLYSWQILGANQSWHSFWPYLDITSKFSITLSHDQ